VSFPSCVRTIEQKLLSLSPPPRSVNVSAVSRSVVINHPKELSAEDIKQVINDAGFDIVPTPSNNSLDTDQSSIYLADKQQRHIEQCSYCKDEDHRNSYETKGQPPNREIPQSVVSTTSHPVERAPQDPTLQITGYGSTSSPRSGFRVTLAVGGMTCASCSTTVTRTISELSGVSDVTVDLLGMSASLIVDHERLAETVVEAINDGGYEAQVVSVEPLHSADVHQVTQTTRTISLRVDGMFCP
jgi:Cu+-exporting ATPase